MTPRIHPTAVIDAAAELTPFPEVQAFIAFVEDSGRGVVT